MPATYTLGKDYTVNGLSGATDLTVTHSAERVDITTRAGSKPFKSTVAGLENLTFECSVYATSTTQFDIGKAYSVTLNGASPVSLICMAANREEPQDGVVTYKLTLRPGTESLVADQIAIGPGGYRGGS